MDAEKIGCNGIQRAMDFGYLQVLQVYVNTEGDETRPVLAMVNGDDGNSPAMNLNYCPFCGQRFAKEMPTCGQKFGVEKMQSRDVRVQS